MLLVIALFVFGWAVASSYVYLERKFPQHEQKIYWIFAIVFSFGAIAILVLWAVLGAGMIKLSDL